MVNDLINSMNKLRHSILILLLTMISVTLFGQNNDVWTAFWNNDTTLIGYKDGNNKIKIAPKFTEVTAAKKFENIIAVIEEINETWSSYYLTKSGRKVGKDSLYIFDNGVDCESEGFIRFRDHKTDKAGMFNRNGDIVIPAEYSDLTRVMNGVFVGLKGAEKDYWNKSDTSDREHYSWIGGEELVVDTLNNVIIGNFAYGSKLSFFSLKKTDTPSSDTIRKSFLAKDGGYYSFVDFEKEFRQWFVSDLLINLTSEKLINNSYDTIVWSSNGWKETDRRKFVTDNFSVLKKGLSEILNPKCKFSIFNDGLNHYIYDNKGFEKYYNNCDEAKDWIYPVMTIVISHENGANYLQDHYSFLRTDDGYKLISVSIRSEKIK